MRIGELSSRSGLRVEAIRFYEKEGLLSLPSRLENNYRAYTHKHLDELNFISHCRSLDMSLADIRTLLHADPRDSEQATHVHALIEKQVKLVNERMASLKALKGHLKALASRCSGNHGTEPCGILMGLNEDAHEGHCHCEDEVGRKSKKTSGNS